MGYAITTVLHVAIILFVCFFVLSRVNNLTKKVKI